MLLDTTISIACTADFSIYMAFTKRLVIAFISSYNKGSNFILFFYLV